MRLPDFTADPGLIALRRSMGADAPGSFSPSYRPDKLTLAELEQLATDGKDVSIEDVIINENNTLGYKDDRVLVYIRDIRQFQNWIPRFHIAHCKTLRQKLQQNGLARYVVTTRDDGSFVVNLIGNDGRITRNTVQLPVCQNCLYELDFDRFSSLSHERRMMIVSQFTIQRFFEKYPRSLHRPRPAGDADTAPINNYPPDFDAISARVRAERGWRCECCRRDFSRAGDRKYLHVHHKNGMKNENFERNLQVLCLGCHVNQPQHAHLKKFPEYHEFLRRLGR
jgi:hypothetical protein